MLKSVFGVLGCLLLFACSSTGEGAPLRSPSLDYAPPPPSTTDSDAVGANRRAPADQLQQGVTSNGPAPGWHARTTGLSYDPKQQVGGAIDPPAATGSRTK